MFVGHDLGDRLIVLDHGDMVATQGPGIHAQRVFDQGADMDRFQQLGGASIGLLGGDDVLDVVDALGQLHQFIGHALLLDGNRVHQLIEVSRQHFALVVVRQEGAQVMGMLVDQLHGLAQPQGLAGPQLTGDQVGGHIHAVEHVADVVQHIRGNFRHAGLAGAVEQLALGVLEFPGAFLDPLFEAFVDSQQGAVDPVDLGEAA